MNRILFLFPFIHSFEKAPQLILFISSLIMLRIHLRKLRMKGSEAKQNKTSVDENLFLILLDIYMGFSHEKLLRKNPHASLK